MKTFCLTPPSKKHKRKIMKSFDIHSSCLLRPGEGSSYWFKFESGSFCLDVVLLGRKPMVCDHDTLGKFDAWLPTKEVEWILKERGVQGEAAR